MEKEFVEYVVKNLVDNKDAVELRVVEGDKSTIFELKVDENDLGKVIGKQGRIAKAIRALLGAIGARSGKRCILEILD